MLLGLVLAGAQAQLRRYKLNEGSQARCLDGSVPSYFMELQDPDNVVIYLEGGSLCIAGDQSSTLAACQSRAGTWLGSSKSENNTLKFDFDLFSSDANRNPLYHNYTKVYVRYCDGSLYQGYRAQPIDYKGSKLYFRGAINFIEVMKELKASGLGAKTVVLSGTSAGGVGTSLWSDYVAGVFANAECYSIIDSGVFPYFDGKKGNPFLAISKFIGGFLNTQRPELSSQKCTDDCFDPAAVIRRITTPHLLLQPFYDQYNLINSAGLTCASGQSLAKCSQSDRALAQKFADTMRNLIAGINNQKTSLFGISCVIHGLFQVDGSTRYEIPSGSGLRVRQAIATWRERKQLWAADKVSWPQNSGCANDKLDQTSDQ